MLRKYIPVETKGKVVERAKGRCEYCKCLRKYSPQPFNIEHIIPIAQGGTSDLDNLALSCGGCNGHKYTKIAALDPVSLQIVSLFHPRKNIWKDHFIWDVSFTKVIGITAIGRATINALHLNRQELINLRKLTKLTGEQPPK
ncbi:MAG: HNH endonuclease [Chitinophagales bacterium]